AFIPLKDGKEHDQSECDDRFPFPACQASSQICPCVPNAGVGIMADELDFLSMIANARQQHEQRVQGTAVTAEPTSNFSCCTCRAQKRFTTRHRRSWRVRPCWRFSTAEEP